MKNNIQIILLILTIGCIACQNSASHNASNKSQEQAIEEKKSHVSIFEIPALDITRAINFYQSVLNIKIEKMEMPGMQMGILPHENQMVIGTIVQGAGYQPSANGVTIYLNGGDNLQFMLDKVEKNGGKIIATKTAHADESGYFALFLDTEGNRIGLHSPN